MHASALGLNLRIGLATAIASFLGACGPVTSIVPNSSRTQSGVEALQRAATAADKFGIRPMTAGYLNCPVVEIEDGAATARVGGPENSAVRYQFDLVDT